MTFLILVEEVDGRRLASFIFYAPPLWPLLVVRYDSQDGLAESGPSESSLLEPGLADAAWLKLIFVREIFESDSSSFSLTIFYVLDVFHWPEDGISLPTEITLLILNFFKPMEDPLSYAPILREPVPLIPICFNCVLPLSGRCSILRGPFEDGLTLIGVFNPVGFCVMAIGLNLPRLTLIAPEKP